MENLDNIAEVKIEDLLEQREKMLLAVEDIQSGVSVLNEEIIRRLDEQKVNGMIVGNRTVTKVKKVYFSTSLEDARLLGATKTEEKVDDAKLRTLHNSGANVPGVRTTQYLMVKDIPTKAEEIAA